MDVGVKEADMTSSDDDSDEEWKNMLPLQIQKKQEKSVSLTGTGAGAAKVKSTGKSTENKKTKSTTVKGKDGSTKKTQSLVSPKTDALRDLSLNELMHQITAKIGTARSVNSGPMLRLIELLTTTVRNMDTFAEDKQTLASSLQDRGSESDSRAISTVELDKHSNVVVDEFLSAWATNTRRWMSYSTEDVDPKYIARILETGHSTDFTAYLARNLGDSNKPIARILRAYHIFPIALTGKNNKLDLLCERIYESMIELGVIVPDRFEELQFESSMDMLTDKISDVTSYAWEPTTTVELTGIDKSLTERLAFKKVYGVSKGEIVCFDANLVARVIRVQGESIAPHSRENAVLNATISALEQGLNLSKRLAVHLLDDTSGDLYHSAAHLWMVCTTVVDVAEATINNFEGADRRNFNFSSDLQKSLDRMVI